MAKWTQFMDMHSGGGQKLDWQYIYIEAPEDEARRVFWHKFGRNPSRVTCTCCGEDYSVTESESLEQATGYNRNCAYVDGKYVEQPRNGGSFLLPERRDVIPLAEYVKSEDVKIVPAVEISPEERIGEIPEEGYVWRD